MLPRVQQLFFQVACAGVFLVTSSSFLSSAKAAEMVDRLDCTQPGKVAAIPMSVEQLGAYRSLTNPELMQRLQSGSIEEKRIAGRVLGDRAVAARGVEPVPDRARRFYEVAAFTASEGKPVFNPGFAGTSPWVMRMPGAAAPADADAMERLAKLYEREGGADNIIRERKLMACVSSMRDTGNVSAATGAK